MPLQTGIRERLCLLQLAEQEGQGHLCPLEPSLDLQEPQMPDKELWGLLFALLDFILTLEGSFFAVMPFLSFKMRMFTLRIVHWSIYLFLPLLFHSYLNS